MAESEQNCSLQIARIKQLLDPDLDRGLVRLIALDLLLDGLSLIERGEQFWTDGCCEGTHADVGIRGRRLAHVDSR